LVAVCQGALIGAVLWFHPRWGFVGAVAALAVGYAIPVAIGLRRLHHIWGHLSVRGQVFQDLRLVLLRDWRFASNQFAGYLNSVLELWLAGILLCAIDTSQFSAAQRLSMLLVIPLISLQAVFAPVVSRFVANDDYQTLERLLRTGATMAAVLTAVAWLPILIAPSALLDLVFGAGFSAAAPVLILLTLGNLANVLTGLAGTALMMSRHESIVVRAQWMAVLARVVSGTLCALQFGATGLGASAAGVTAAMMIWLWLAARRRMGVWTHLTPRPSLRLMRETAG
jgi:O-antigen/teichoic acid export membrane protein